MKENFAILHPTGPIIVSFVFIFVTIVCRHILDLLRSLGQSYTKKKKKANMSSEQAKKEKQTHDLKLIIRKVRRL